MSGFLEIVDPIKLGEYLWPHVEFYDKQQEVIYSVWDNDETYVPAGNMLGKDFVAGFIVLAYFLTRNPCRILTTSVKDQHLDVLWGEINRFIQTSRAALPLKVNHHEIKKVAYGQVEPLSYLIGTVASNETIASFQGHHVADVGDGVPRTLGVTDEASGVPDDYYKMMITWARRILVIGNPWPCENFFKRAVKGRPGTDDHGGDIPRDSGVGYYRRVIKITAKDSPNVKWAEHEIEKGERLSGRILVPGVKPYDEYLKNRKLWDPIQQCVSLDAEFYEGAGVRLFPKEWLDRAEEYARTLNGIHRQARTIGCDPAMGGDNTAWAVCDSLGLMALESRKTPDTTVIVSDTIALMHRYGVKAEDVYFDYGGGGKPHVDRLRSMGYNVKAVQFGDPASPDIKPRGVVATVGVRKVQQEVRSFYKNRRAELYGTLHFRLDPSVGPQFALPPDLLNRVRGDGGASLRYQLQPIPLDYTEEGQLFVAPKQPRSDDKGSRDKVYLVKLIGCSPDEADAVVLACWGLTRKIGGYKIRSIV